MGTFDDATALLEGLTSEGIRALMPNRLPARDAGGRAALTRNVGHDVLLSLSAPALTSRPAVRNAHARFFIAMSLA